MRDEVQHRRTANPHVGGVEAPRAARRRPSLGALCGLCGLTLAAAAPAALAQDQETVVIGGGPGSVTTGTYRPSGSGVVVNDDVLDSLGPGPTPKLPYSGESDIQSPAVAGLPPGTAYRLPETGQLVVTRPSTLLFPPLKTPQSHLTLTPPAAASATAPQASMQAAGNQAAGGTSGKVASQLLIQPQEAPPSPAPSAAPAPQVVTQQDLAAAPKAMPETIPETTPEPPAAPEPAPAPAEMGASAESPPSPSMTAPEPPSAPSVSAPELPKPQVTAPQPKAAAVESPPAPDLVAPPTAPETAEPSAVAPSGQSAALPGALGPQRIDFAAGSAELTAVARQTLDGIAARMQSKKSIRAQLLAYAADAGDGGSQARRLSLSRALAVRAYLIDKGVRSTRLDVRALGSNVPVGPPDRVDIIPQSSG